MPKLFVTDHGIVTAGKSKQVGLRFSILLLLAVDLPYCTSIRPSLIDASEFLVRGHEEVEPAFGLSVSESGTTGWSGAKSQNMMSPRR